MSISTRTREILWARSGNACARCKSSLVQEPESEGDIQAIVGQECHIIARLPDGPRGAAGAPSDIDGYENLILLCANCHVLVDTHVDQFSPESLRQMKDEHEKPIAYKLMPRPILQVRGREKPMTMSLQESGDRLLGLLAHSYTTFTSHPGHMSDRQRSVIGDFLQACQDWTDILRLAWRTCRPRLVMAKTIGIDRASQPGSTAVCVIDWSQSPAEVVELANASGWTDDALLDLL